jgi:valyl-tRNA synthetase
MNCPDDDNGFEQCTDGFMNFSQADRWITSIFQNTLKNIESNFENYRFDLAAQEMYQFIWDEYCDWYLEVAKVQLNNSNSEATIRGTKRTLLGLLENILKMVHPMMPFISEEIWQIISHKTGTHSETIMLQSYPLSREKKIDKDAEVWMQTLKNMVEECRKLRGEMNISPAEKVPLLIIGNAEAIQSYQDYLVQLAKLESVSVVDKFEKIDAPVSIVGEYKLMLKVEIDVAAEKQRLQKEIDKLTIELKKADGKLANQSFIEKAPESVIIQEKERQKKFSEDLQKFKEQLSRLDS